MFSNRGLQTLLLLWTHKEARSRVWFRFQRISQAKANDLLISSCHETNCEPCMMSTQIIYLLSFAWDCRGHAVAMWLSTTLPAGRSWFRDPMWMNVITLPIPSSLTKNWGSLSPWRKWVPEAEKLCCWRVERGRCLWLITLPLSVSRLSRQCRILNYSEPHRPPRPVTRIFLLFTFFASECHVFGFSLYWGT
jgi:hypothetical protein